MDTLYADGLSLRRAFAGNVNRLFIFLVCLFGLSMGCGLLGTLVWQVPPSSPSSSGITRFGFSLMEAGFWMALAFASGIMALYVFLTRVISLSGFSEWWLAYLRVRIYRLGERYPVLWQEAQSVACMDSVTMEKWLSKKEKEMRYFPDSAVFCYGKSDADMDEMRRQYPNPDEPKPEDSSEYLHRLQPCNGILGIFRFSKYPF